MSTTQVREQVYSGKHVNYTRDAAYAFDSSGIDEIQSFRLLHYGAKELHFSTTLWRTSALFYLRHTMSITEIATARDAVPRTRNSSPSEIPKS